ncbi:protein-disulfide reductase DsbD domain-containing protein [Pelagibacterium montanilacus]|uniref:protein-disulfide reductase DsbD domain-containing protein n=1 Tax=Pelagibacterium montanilacus TaxID=2185280 RepID=UPI000F8E1AFF|nr:protein-disulfide reductase DsbD domain-containing protein [Pelagibacterium montanilacus]
MKTLVPVAMLAVSLSAPGVMAGQTAWEEVFPDVAMRVISSDVMLPDQTTWVALEIDMPTDTKTYWKVPGESGIPAQLDMSGSQGIDAAEPVWPYPTRETRAGYLDHVFYGHFVLPIQLSVTGSEPRLAADFTLGICSDVCVPVAVSFETALDFGVPDRAQSLRIDQALADVPVPAPQGLLEVGEAHYDPDSHAIVLDWQAASDISGIIGEIDGRMTLLGPPEHDETGRTLAFPVYGKMRDPIGTDASMTLSFATSEGPYRVTTPLRAR